MPPKRAPISFMMISRNGRDTLPAAIKSIRPYVEEIVVGIDTYDREHTDKVAKKAGADKVFPVVVSEEHECDAHGKVLAQHFANARNEVMKRVSPGIAWRGWLDSDDVIEGAANLPTWLNGDVPDPIIGFWSEYIYAAMYKEDGTRVPNTVFHRERILRSVYQGKPVNWEWENRVHETVRPLGVEHPKWAMMDNVTWVHQHNAHKSETSGPRNLLLLEMELEADPESLRTNYYMGNQYFAMGEWAQAAQWYEHYAALPVPDKNPYELWQALCYASLSYERLGRLDLSEDAALRALVAVPEHPEPYYRLAAIAAARGESGKAIYWTQEGDRRPDSPFFTFKNPMDRTFNSKLPLASAYLDAGKITEARQTLEVIANTFPDEKVVEQLRLTKQQELAETVANSYLDMCKVSTEDQALELYARLPDRVKQFGRARNVMATVLRGRRTALTQPRIIFWCNANLEPWAPPSLNTTGIGGSETAVVEIAKRFAAAGWLTDVYNSADYMEGVYDGVGYWDPARIKDVAPPDVFVGWRRPEDHNRMDARQKVLWCHDLHNGPGATEDYHQWQKVLGVSQWHADMLGRYYDVKAGFVPNGINAERFPQEGVWIGEGEKRKMIMLPPKKVPFRCVYASSPDRGLMRLLDLWPKIVESEPEAELHVAYGWQNFDKMIASGRTEMLGFKNEILRKLEAAPRVVWRDRLPQNELAKLYSESYLWLYPTDFLEVSCISAMEAMAGGAVPVTTSCGALPETIGSAGLLIPAPYTSRGYAPTWLNVARGLLTDKGTREQYAAKGRERVQELTWDRAAARWFEVLAVDLTPEVSPDDEPPADPDSHEDVGDVKQVHGEMVAA